MLPRAWECAVLHREVGVLWLLRHWACVVGEWNFQGFASCRLVIVVGDEPRISAGRTGGWAVRGRRLGLGAGVRA